MVLGLPPSEVVSFIDKIIEYHLWVASASGHAWSEHVQWLPGSISSFFPTTGPGRLDTVYYLLLIIIIIIIIQIIPFATVRHEILRSMKYFLFFTNIFLVFSLYSFLHERFLLIN